MKSSLHLALVTAPLYAVIIPFQIVAYQLINVRKFPST